MQYILWASSLKKFISLETQASEDVSVMNIESEWKRA